LWHWDEIWTAKFNLIHLTDLKLVRLRPRNVAAKRPKGKDGTLSINVSSDTFFPDDDLLLHYGVELERSHTLEEEDLETFNIVNA
jgi:hypothetical protein